MKNIIIYLAILFLVGCKPDAPSEYVILETDLVPEGICYSKGRDVFFLSSIAKSKIIELDRRTGTQKDFLAKGEFGYSPGVGLHMDDERKLLYALGGYYIQSDSLSSLFVFDVRTGQLLKKFDLAGTHFLNDLTQDKKGNIYLTDTKGSALFVLPHGNDSLELFFESPEIAYPNGITISEDNTKLYIASASQGVRILDLASKKILNTPDTSGISQGIDGLKFHRNHLYAVQNGVAANSDNFRKIILNETQDRIISFEVLDSHTSRLDIPLTFCIVEDEAVVIGNSNLQYLNQETMEFSDLESIPQTRLIIYQLDQKNLAP